MDRLVDKIMEEFRLNGRDADYMELDLDAMDLERYSPDARSLMIGLLHEPSLEPEAKIIRPPSKTPQHLPTSTVNLLKKQFTHQHMAHMPMTSNGFPMAHPPLPSPAYFVQGLGQPSFPRWGSTCSSPSSLYASPSYASPSYASPSYVAELATSFSEMAHNQPVQGQSYVISTSSVVGTSLTVSASSRPIYGSGLSMKPFAKQNRVLKYDKCTATLSTWDACVDWVTSSQPLMTQPTTPTLTQESLETPKLIFPPTSVRSVEKKANIVTNESWGNSSDLDCSQDDGVAVDVDNVSADSGNFTAGELSPRSSSGASPSPSYAAVLNTPSQSGTDEPVDSRSDVTPGTPKSRHPEGFKVWKHKKFSRSSESGSGSHDEIYRAKECVFCKTNGETPSLYRGHVLKDDQGRTTCHVLQKYICPLCGATGEKAHTVKYCPKNQDPPVVSMMTTLKSMRSATGNLRMMSNTRRIRSSAKRAFRGHVTYASSNGSP